MSAVWCGLMDDPWEEDTVQCECCLNWVEDYDTVLVDELGGMRLCQRCWAEERAEHPECYAWMDMEGDGMTVHALRAELLAVFQAAFDAVPGEHYDQPDALYAGVCAVARHVLADTERWCPAFALDTSIHTLAERLTRVEQRLAMLDAQPQLTEQEKWVLRMHTSMGGTRR